MDKWKNKTNSKLILSILTILIVTRACIEGTIIRDKREKVGRTNTTKMEGNKEVNKIVIGTWNKGGKWDCKLSKKIGEIENLLKSQKIDILGVQEANWTQDMDEATVRIPGYEIIPDKGRSSKKRKNSRTVVYIRDDIHYEILTNKMREEVPEVWLRISEPGKRKTDLVVFYREYKQWRNKETEAKREQEDRYRQWCKRTSDQMLKRGDTIVVGDFNGDWARQSDIKYVNKNIVEITKKELPEMEQMVNEYTRVPINNDKPSLIDWVMTNARQRIRKVGTTFTTSDHKLVRVELLLKIEVEPEFTEGRSWRNVDKKEVIRRATATSWKNNWGENIKETAYEKAERIDEQEGNKEQADRISINEAEDKKIGKMLDKNIRQMTKKMNGILDECGAKIERKQKQPTRATYITGEIRDMIKKDKERRKDMQKNGKEYTQERVEEVKKEHKKLRRKLKTAKLKACRKAITKKMNDARTLFEGIKNYNNEGNDGAPKQFKVEGRLIKRKEEMSEAQHDYYDNKLKTVEKKVGPPKGNYMRILENRTKDRESILRMRRITGKEIEEEIKRVKDKPSYGTDKISYTVLKLFVDHIKEPLAEIGTISFIYGIYPEVWKTSIVKPLYKGGQKSKTDPASYRPVSLLCAAGRIIEGIMAGRMTRFAEDRKLLPSQMHGYRPGLGTTTALIELQSDILRKNGEGKITGMSLLDVSAGFDTVPHSYLLRKLEALGYSQRTLKWFISYLENRWAMVQIGGERSRRRRIKKGIPQGGPMSPALWREYTIDLTGSLTEETTKWRREIWREQKDRKEEEWGLIDKRNSIVTRRGMKKWEMGAADAEETHDLKKHIGKEIKINKGTDDEHPIMGRLEQEKGFTLYVDDCSTRAYGKEIETVRKRQKDATTAVFQTMRESRLCINADKTQIMIIMSQQRRTGTELKNKEYILELEGNKQKEIKDGEILGVTISNDLTWTRNWSRTNTRISKKLSKLIGVQNIMGIKNRKKVVESTCVSLITYGIEVTSGGGKTLIKNMDNTLSKQARYVTNQKKRDYRKEAAFRRLKWLTVPQIVYWQSMKTLLKFKKDKKPQNITDRILGGDGKPRLITRQQLETMPLTSRQGWEVRVRRWWEEMDEELKSDEVDIRKAKWGRKLKEYARNNYPKDGEKILYGGL